jgi:hypothetical protein
MKETRARSRILAEARHLCFKITKIEWQTIGIAFEMCGPSGGWEVRAENGYLFHGYNVDEVIADMRDAALEPSTIAGQKGEKGK